MFSWGGAGYCGEPAPVWGAYGRLAGHVRGEPIGDAVIDGAFVGSPDATGEVRSVLRDPGTGLRLAGWQERGLIHVFTGDAVARDRRTSVTIEPVEVMTDAFNRPDCARAIQAALIGSGPRGSGRTRDTPGAPP